MAGRNIAAPDHRRKPQRLQIHKDIFPFAGVNHENMGIVDAALLNDTDAGGVKGIDLAVDKLHAFAVKAAADFRRIVVVKVAHISIILRVIEEDGGKIRRQLLIFYFNREIRAIQYGAEQNWEAVCRRIENAYGHLPFAATINNLSMVTLALLEGKLDYTRTITTTVMCGMDADCNAGTAGSIVGAAIGIDNIESRWTDPLNDTIRSGVACFGTCSISDIIARICKLKEKI